MTIRSILQVFHALLCPQGMGVPATDDWKHYRIYIYNTEFDLTEPIDWYFSDNHGKRWPAYHYAQINYRSGNPNGDVRVNWELSRLQFLPEMAVTDSAGNHLTVEVVGLFWIGKALQTEQHITP